MRIYWLLIGSLLPVLSSVTYAVSIVRGRSKPHRMTRFLLMLITALMLLSLLANHDRSGVWLALVSFIQAVGLWILSLRRGMGGRSTLDIACLLLCMLGLICWLVFGRAWIGLCAAIFADVIACTPALRKTIRWPHTEQGLFYFLDIFAGLFIILAGPFTAKAMVFPLYIALINAVFACAIWVPRRTKLEAEEAA